METVNDLIAASQRPRENGILQAQKQAWNHFSQGWEKWDDFTMRFLDGQRAAIVEALDVSPDAVVLDVATGTGEPGLSLASRAARGSVTALDASEGMLRIARAKAAARGLTNFRTVEGDACALPFADESFDAISCRLGFMFFPDMRAAAREMFRVLRPGGVLAATVWAGPEHNSWITTLVGAIKQHMAFPTPPPGAPGMFRCADPQSLPELLASAGLSVERRSLRTDPMRCRSAEEYWSFMNDVVPPVVATLREADPITVAKVESDVIASLLRASPETAKVLGAGAHCVVARK